MLEGVFESSQEIPQMWVLENYTKKRSSDREQDHTISQRFEYVGGLGSGLIGLFQEKGVLKYLYV